MAPSLYWKVASYFAFGVIGGMLCLLIMERSRHSGKPEHEIGIHSVNEWDGSVGSGQPTLFQLGERLEREPNVAASKLIEEGDTLLATGNTLMAESRYQLVKQVVPRLSHEVLFRLAFCAELNHQPGKAARYYRQILDNQPHTVHRWVALSGLSRTWIERGNRIEALQVLMDLFVDSLAETNMSEELKAQILYQLGTAFQDIALEQYHYDLTLGDGVVFHAVFPRVEEQLKSIDGIDKRNPSYLSDSQTADVLLTADEPKQDNTLLPIDNRLKIEVLQRPNHSIELMVVGLTTPILPVNEIIKHLASSCELEVYATPAAQHAIAGRAKFIRAEGINASLLLDSLLIPFNVIWYQDEQGLQLVTINESLHSARQFFPLAMERFFRRLNLTLPGDYRTASALLSRANMKFIHQQIESAATHYQELAQRSPNGELLAKLFFNLGKVEMRLGRTGQAIERFYLTVDQTYDTQLQSAAYWLVAQLSLEINQLSAAIKAAGRALNLSNLDHQKRLAAMTMARAYLLANQPLSANQVLFDNRKSFAGSSSEPTAAILGSFARVLGMTDRVNLHSETQRLLTALANATETDFHNFLDIYIAARAWQELGFRDRTVDLLKLAIESTTIPQWRRQFLFELGVQLRLAEQYDDSIALFEYVINSEHDNWVQKSMMQLAHLYLETGLPERCIEAGYEGS